eukprot:scaffold359_cov313-Prasinococcus_capsulatus_cf.AAC.11
MSWCPADSGARAGGTGRAGAAVLGSMIRPTSAHEPCDDAGLLLTCGKDNRTLCWDTMTGEVVSELPPSDNWNFDVQWSPTVPGLCSTASFDGKVQLHNALGGGAGAAEDAFFGSAGACERLAAVACDAKRTRAVGVSE